MVNLRAKRGQKGRGEAVFYYERNFCFSIVRDVCKYLMVCGGCGVVEKKKKKKSKNKCSKSLLFMIKKKRESNKEREGETSFRGSNKEQCYKQKNSVNSTSGVPTQK